MASALSSSLGGSRAATAALPRVVAVASAPAHRRGALERRRQSRARPRLSTSSAASGDGATKGPDPSDLSSIASDILASSPDVQARLSRVGDAAARVAELQAKAAAVDRELASLSSSERDDPEAARRLEAVAAADALVKQREAELAEATAAAALGAAERAAALASAEASAARRAAAADADRLASAKTAAVAGAAAALASVPVALASNPTPLSALLSVVSFGAGGLLFGVVYRYATAAAASSNDDGDPSSPPRISADPSQLRAGVVAAFGLTRGIGAAESLQSLAASDGKFPLALDVVGRAALAAGEGVLVAAFAAAAVEAAVGAGFLAPLGGGSGNSKK